MTLAREMYDFRNTLANKGIVFCYSGYITEDVLTSIGQAIRLKMELEESGPSVARNVFSVFVEQVQNIIRYSAEKEKFLDDDSRKELRYGVLSVGRKDGTFFVACSNLIDNQDVEKLDTSLKHIQTLSDQDLKQLYKDTLRNDSPEGSKGAGVGFVDIARRAKKGFEFGFIPVDNDRNYFSIKAYV